MNYLLALSLVLCLVYSAENYPRHRTSFSSFDDAGYYSSKSGEPQPAAKIYSYALLNKQKELLALLEDPENVLLLDCRINSKCPIEQVFLRHNRDLARQLVDVMASSLKFKELEDTFSKGEGLDSVPFRVILSNDVEAVRTMMDVMGADICNSTLPCTWGTSNLLEFCRAYGKKDILAVLQNEYHCHDPTARSTSCTTSSSDSPRPHGVTTSSSFGDDTTAHTASPPVIAPKKSKSRMRISIPGMKRKMKDAKK